MRCKIKKGLIFLIFVGICIATARFCHKQTLGFRLSKVQDNLFYEQIVNSLDPKPFLQQKFHFFSRGLQSFVFLSEDENYVLKLFNNRYQKKIQFFSWLAYLPLFKDWARTRLQYYQSKLERTGKSYSIAFSEMKDKTGLLYLHLEKTEDLPTSLKIVDKLGICHEIDPNCTGFLIQKRATLVYPELQKCVASKDLNAAKQAIRSLIDLFFWKWRHGIDDNDPLIRTNYGFIDSCAVQIDVGPLSKRSGIKSIDDQCVDMRRVTESLRCWLEGNAPELVCFLEEEIEKQLAL